MAPWWEYVLRLVLATVFGALIGWEREVRGKPAGLRTLMLVTLPAAVYVAAAEQAAMRRGEAVDAGQPGAARKPEEPEETSPGQRS